MNAPVEFYFDLMSPYAYPGVSSLTAMRAFVWLKARAPALAVAFAKRIFERLWVRGMDITSVQAVADEAVALGLHRDDILEMFFMAGRIQRISPLPDLVDRRLVLRQGPGRENDLRTHSAGRNVHTTPFGREVVPDVNMINASRSGSGTRAGIGSQSSESNAMAPRAHG